MRRQWVFAAATLALWAAASSKTYWVGGTGQDAAANGSATSPWLTIAYAVSRAPSAGGDTIMVRDGVYNGRSYITGSFADWLTIRPEHDYRVTLTNLNSGTAGEIFGIYTPGSAHIRVEGFVLTNADGSYTCPNGRESNYLVHFQDSRDIDFENNILHGNNAPGACNELLKVNRGDTLYYPRNILIKGNVFYDRPSAGGTDLIDAMRPGELDIVENIFFERSAPLAQSFITLKTEVPADSMPASLRPPRNPRYRICRNIFLNWDGQSDQAFLQLGEDALSEYMITNALIENNLMIGNSAHPMAAPFQFKGCKDITVRANTIVGDVPGGSFGFRIGTEGTNPRSSGFTINDNLWCDPTGTMTGRFVNTYGDVDTATIKLDNNLFWNAGAALPTQGSILPASDPHRIVADPAVGASQAAVTLPVWDTTRSAFASGSTTIRQEFERLALLYGAPGPQSAARDAANAAQMPADDILGRPRDARPDIGAVELQQSATVTRVDRHDAGPVIRLQSGRIAVCAPGALRLPAQLTVVDARGSTVCREKLTAANASAGGRSWHFPSRLTAKGILFCAIGELDSERSTTRATAASMAAAVTQ